MFDRIIEQAAGRFGLGPDQARQLLGALIGLVFDHRCGGAASFMQRLQGQGLGDVAKSWLGQGARQPITPAQLESALGAGAIGGIASRLGLPESTVSVAAASMLPDALGELSENGALPTGIPQGLRQWMGGLGELVGDISHWGAGAVGASGAGIGGVGDAVGQAGRRAGAGLHRAADAVGDARGRGRHQPVDPVVTDRSGRPAALLLSRGCKREDTAPGTEAQAPAATATAPAAASERTESRLSLTRTDGKVSYEGVVDSDATKTSILAALHKAFDANNVSGTSRWTRTPACRVGCRRSQASCRSSPPMARR